MAAAGARVNHRRASLLLYFYPLDRELEEVSFCWDFGVSLGRMTRAFGGSAAYNAFIYSISEERKSYLSVFCRFYFFRGAKRRDPQEGRVRDREEEQREGVTRKVTAGT